jgi:hypothetical protein
MIAFTSDWSNSSDFELSLVKEVALCCDNDLFRISSAQQWFEGIQGSPPSETGKPLVLGYKMSHVISNLISSGSVLVTMASCNKKAAHRAVQLLFAQGESG